MADLTRRGFFSRLGWMGFGAALAVAASKAKAVDRLWDNSRPYREQRPDFYVDPKRWFLPKDD